MSKVLSLPEAIRRYVPDGASVCLGTALECLIKAGTFDSLDRPQNARAPGRAAMLAGLDGLLR